jgi:glycine cleavage system H lipoate-binding protein
MVLAIQKDPNAIGFCRLTDILDPGKQQIVENISIMPIDRNNNGKIDYNEQIYSNLNVFNRAVWIGKYPKSLYNSIYSYSSSKPTGETEVAFLKWVLTDGQQYVSPNGYSELALNERQSKASELNTAKIEITESGNDYAKLKIILLILATFLLSSFILDAGLRYRKNINEGIHITSSVFQPVFNENSVKVLNGLYFDKTHTWAFMEKDGLVKIGIDDFLQHVTGSITQLKLKNPGEKIRKCEPVLSIVHEGKQLTINAPVSGIIKEQNLNLIKNSSLVNSSPFSEGWIYRIEPTNWMRDIQFLFMGEKYKIWLKDEFSRLRDFLSAIVKPGSQAILQDGGEIKDCPLSNLGPEVWEDFQANFIDTSK